jgi:hypothetical protein
VVETLVRVARFVGLSVGTEQAVPGQLSRHRPGDLVVHSWQDGEEYYFDVAVVSQLAHSWDRSWVAGKALEDRAVAKRLLYSYLFAPGLPRAFVPLIFDTFGGCHPLVTPVLDRLDELLSGTVVESDDTHFRSVRVQLSHSVAVSVGLQLAARLG